MKIQRSEIVAALQGLVEGGLAKAYDLSASGGDPFSREIAGMPPLDIAEVHFRTYFYITEEGMHFLQADDTWWPFDDKGSLRPGWNPPE